MKLEPVSLLSIFIGLISNFISSNVWQCKKKNTVKSVHSNSPANSSRWVTKRCQFICFHREAQTPVSSLSLPSVYQFVWGAGKTARTAPVVSLNWSFHRAEWQQSPLGNRTERGDSYKGNYRALINVKAQISFCSPSNEAEYIKGQVEYGKGSKGDKEEHNSKTPPSPDGQTGLKHTSTDTWKPLCTFPLLKVIGDSLKKTTTFTYTNKLGPPLDALSLFILLSCVQH